MKRAEMIILNMKNGKIHLLKRCLIGNIRGRIAMTDKDIAFKAKADALKDAADIRMEQEKETAEIRCEAYRKGVDDVMNAYIEVRSEKDA